MRKVYLILGVIILMTSCENKINEIVPRASLSPDAITSVGDLEKLMTGAYDGLQGGTSAPPSAGLYYLGYLTEDLSADNLIYRATFFQHGEIDANAILTSNVLTQRYWIAPYIAIYRANELLRLLNGFDASAFPNPARKDHMIGELKYIRAYSYYRLVTLFGGVPVLTTNTTANVPRNTEDEVWAQIEVDLDDAILKAPNFSDIGYVSKDAAKAMRARVALIRGDNDIAEDLAEEVIASANFALTDDYDAIFDVGSNGAGEVIFQVYNTETEGQSSHSFFLLDPTINPFGASGRFELPADPTLVAAYEDGDIRKAASVAPARTTFFQAIKYRSGALSSDPFYISRISEMYLISSEAKAKIANDPAAGMARLNEVRNKRGLGNLATPASMDDFITAILHERRVEFAFEGLRWTDLKRTGRAIDVLPGVTNANQLLYPIPQTEIDVNPLLTQNPGY